MVKVMMRRHDITLHIILCLKDIMVVLGVTLLFICAFVTLWFPTVMCAFVFAF